MHLKFSKEPFQSRTLQEIDALKFNFNTRLSYSNSIIIDVIVLIIKISMIQYSVYKYFILGI